MRGRIKGSTLLLGLMAIGLSAWLGMYWKQRTAGLDLWCSGQGARQLPDQAGAPRWLLSRYSFDLSPDGSGHYRLLARLLDAEQAPLGQMQRHVAFSYQLQGQRLLLKVEHSGKSESDSLIGKQLPTAHLAILQPDAVLGFRIRRLGNDLYLLDNGVGFQQLCRSATADALPDW